MKTAEEIWDKHFSRWTIAGQIKRNTIAAMEEYAAQFKQSPSPSLSAEQEAREYADGKVNKNGTSHAYTGQQVFEMLAAAHLAGKGSAGDVIERIRQFDLTDIDAPAFTHTKEFEEHFKYIKGKLIDIIDKPLPTPPVK